MASTLVGTSAGGLRSASRDVSAYRGLGTWIDIYSPAFRANPQSLAASLAQRGVRTLFVETGNYRQRVDLVQPSQLGALIDAAHAQHIVVVAWYLPSLVKPELDLRRALAAARFTSASGEHFDSFALDIEASIVRNVNERTRRLLALSTQLRAAVGPVYPLGAIIPSPVGMQLLPRYWPHFPYASLAETYDVVLPMAYFSYRTRDPAAVARYVRKSVAIIRAKTARPTLPIHVIGGLSGATSKRDAAAFVQAAVACGATGFSLYDFLSTNPAVWSVLEKAPATQPVFHC